MSSTDDNIFKRMSIIVDKYFEGNISDFAEKAGISRQYYYDMRDIYNEGKEPNIGFYKLQGIVSAIDKETDVSIAWFLTGMGEMKAKSPDTPLSGQVDSHKKSVGALREGDIDPVRLAEYLVKNQEAVLKFLRSLEEE